MPGTFILRAMSRLDTLPRRELAGGHVVVEAETRASRLHGLSGLAEAELPASRGLHIPRCRSVHTLRMRFALDLIWLGRDGRMVRVDREVAPRRMKSCLRARSVVEVRAGCADAFLAAGL
jgi:uncharacterized membrane protein (UPF0127 family)